MTAGWSYYIEFRGQRIPLSEGTVTVGRSRYCDVSLDDPSISRKHMQLKIERGSVQLIDLGSSNGTLVNGQRAQEITELNSGDTLLMGDAEIRLIVEAPLFDDADSEPLSPDTLQDGEVPPSLQTVRLPAAREAPRVPGDATSFLARASVELAQQAMDTDASQPADVPPAAAKAVDVRPPGMNPSLATQPLPTLGHAQEGGSESSFADIFSDESAAQEKTSPVQLPSSPPVSAAGTSGVDIADSGTGERTPSPLSDGPVEAPSMPELSERSSPWAAATPAPDFGGTPDFGGAQDLPPPSFDLPNSAPETAAPLPDIEIDFSSLQVDDPDPLPPPQPIESPRPTTDPPKSAPASPDLSDVLLAPDAGPPSSGGLDSLDTGTQTPDLPADLLTGPASAPDPIEDFSLPEPALPEPALPEPALPEPALPASGLPKPTLPEPATAEPPQAQAPVPATVPLSDFAPPASPAPSTDPPIDTTPRGKGLDILPSLDDLESAIGPQMPALPSPDTPAPATHQAPGPAPAHRTSRPAGFWLRAAALLLDSLWVLLLGLGASLTWDGPTDPRGQQLGLMVANGIWFIVVLIGWSFWGSTPGKRLLGLHICQDDDRPGIGVGRTLLRLVGYTLSTVLLGVGFLLVAFHPEKKGLHDLISGTRVVRS